MYILRMWCIGIFTDSDSDSDQSLFVCERETFATLCSGLTQPCQCRSTALRVTKSLQVLYDTSSCSLGAVN